MTDAMPHNREAEESLLGAMFLSGDALRAAADTLDPTDFYLPQHGQIFAAAVALYHRESPVDTTTVAAELEQAGHLEGVGGRRHIMTLIARTPASANAVHYASLVADAATARRAIGLAYDLRTAGLAGDLEAVARVVTSAEDHLAAAATITTAAEDVADMVADESEPDVFDWIIRDCLERGDRLILTGPEGQGKSLMLRQLAVQVAIGTHPWQGITDEPPHRVLFIDLENSRRQSRREFRPLLSLAGRAYTRGSMMLAVKCRPQGIDLTAARDVRWTEALLRHHRPDMLVMGPLYKMYRGSERGSKESESAADIVTSVLDRLRVRYGCALLLEGHTVHDSQDFRPRGSRLWEGWPEFGYAIAPSQRPAANAPAEDGAPERSVTGRALAPIFRWKSWRGDRDANRNWPSKLDRAGFDGGGWPWRPVERDPSRAVTREQTTIDYDSETF